VHCSDALLASDPLEAPRDVPGDRVAGPQAARGQGDAVEGDLRSHGSATFAAAVRILSVVGNRPQFVKSAPLSLALREHGVEEVVLHTGQHYDRELSQVFFEELGLDSPAYRLDAGSGTHAEQVARMLPGIESAALEERPDWVVVLGDTNSTLAGALAGAKAGFRVAHVEAGLRSFDLTMPEELNRLVVDRVSSLLFCPSEIAATNLQREGIVDGVRVVGDVMLDANLRLAPIARERSQALALTGVEPGGFVLATVHREANVREPALAGIVEALNALEEPVVLPLHPRTAAAIEQQGHRLRGHVHPRPPAGYLDFAAFASQARVVLTDSGGVQKEAYWYGVPCVTLRDSTEWVETVELGWNRLVGSDPDRIVKAAREAERPSQHPPLYGDGRAADSIADLICTIDRQ
jgi:UDP-GlcNAc3NAcA epimerase